MNDNLPMDDAEVVRRIRGILAEPYNADYMVQQIRDLVATPKPEPRPIRRDTRGWIEFDDAVIPLPDSPHDPRD